MEKEGKNALEVAKEEKEKAQAQDEEKGRGALVKFPPDFITCFLKAA